MVFATGNNAASCSTPAAGNHALFYFNAHIQALLADGKDPDHA
jgi:hypothetical protein